MQSVQIIHFVLVRIEILDSHNEDPTTMFVEAFQHVVAPMDKNSMMNFKKILQKIPETLLTSAGSILIEIEKSTILTQFFRIEIVKKSIFFY